jgi:hypothetical protein
MGRSADIEGIFVATDEEIAGVIGKEVDFGEIAGKHSEVVIDIGQSNIRLVSDAPDFVEQFELLDCACGINPLDYYEPDEEDED